MNVVDRKGVTFTQKDIAEALGYAQSTVATALNPGSRHKLSPDIVERIQKHADKIGYRPQRFAQILQGKKSRVVGIVTLGGLSGGAESAINRLVSSLREGDCHVFLESFRDNPKQVLNYLLDNMAECVVLCDSVLSGDAEFLGALQQRGVPMVGFRAACHDGLIAAVRQDVRKAFCDLARLHLALGSKDLCLSLPYRDPSIVPLSPPWTNTERALGFCEAIWEAGGEVICDPDAAGVLWLPRSKMVKKPSGKKIVGRISHPVERPSINNAFDLGYFFVQAMAKKREVPDSLLCSNDEMAIGALAACTDFSIEVPDQLRVSGCDNSAVGNFASSPVTTIRQPNEQMTDKIAKIVHEIMAGSIKAPMKGLHKFSCDIIAKRSIGTEGELDRVFAGSREIELDAAIFHRTVDRRVAFGE